LACAVKKLDRILIAVKRRAIAEEAAELSLESVLDEALAALDADGSRI
jgi:hypothetical protein